MLQIPAKDFFNFNEVATIAGIKPYVLRFWESEFERITPSKSEDGSKIYSRENIELILKIKDLLFDEKLSIPKAKLALENFEYANISVAPEQTLELQEVEEIVQPEPVEIESSFSIDLDLATVRSEIAKIKENLNELKNHLR